MNVRNETLFLIGGKNSKKNTGIREVLRLNLGNKLNQLKAIRLTQLHHPRFDCTGVYMNGYIYAFGGHVTQYMEVYAPFT